MTFRKSAPLLLAIPALLLAGCGDDDSDTTSQEGATDAQTGSPLAENATAPSGDAVRAAKVEIVDFAYDPDRVTIEAGGKVIWQNQDSAEHTATLEDGSFDTGPLAEGKLKSQSFKQPGTYPYFCEIHPDMKGTLEVVAG